MAALQAGSVRLAEPPQVRRVQPRPVPLEGAEPRRPPVRRLRRPASPLPPWPPVPRPRAWPVPRPRAWRAARPRAVPARPFPARAFSSSARKTAWPWATTSPIALVISAHERIASSLPGHDVVDPIRVAVGVDEPDYRDAQALGFAHGDRLCLEVDHEQGVGSALHVLHPAQVGPQLRQVCLSGHALARRQQRELTLGLIAFEIVQAPDALVDRLEVGEQTAEPTMVDIRHVSRLGNLLDGVAGLLLGAHEQHGATAMGDLGREFLGLLQKGSGLQEVDDVDAVALAVDEAAHLRVPAARLMAEMDSGLQQVRDSYLAHGYSLNVVLWIRAKRRGPEHLGSLGQGRVTQSHGVLDLGMTAQDTRLPKQTASSSRLCGLSSSRRFGTHQCIAQIAGKGDSTSTGAPVIGCGKARRVACRNCRSRPSKPGVPYSGSPHTGWSIACRCTRI